MKKLLPLLLLLIFGWSTSLRASHLMGGEITWTCITSGPNVGKFQFNVKLYRDCNGIPGPGSITLQTNAPVGSINCALVTQTDISPQGPGCPTCGSPGGYPNAVEEFVYQSNPLFITGVPPATGWYFYYSDCCRNAAITNLSNTGSGEFILRAVMYPYNATNTNPCYDSSPAFAERPQLATCTGDTTYYNANAVDIELDSLVYEWGRPLAGNVYPGTNYPFAPNYAYNNPMPGPAINPSNVSATLNQSTGVVMFRSVTAGAFVTVTKVTAYKCGIKVSEIFREIQIALIAGCNMPNVAPHFGALNTSPDIVDAGGNKYTDVIDTVFAGDTVEYSMWATDFEILKNGPPYLNQSISLSATSVMFGTNFTSTSTGCPYPPCAVLEKVTGGNSDLLDTVAPIQPIWKPSFLAFKFKWVTDCNHLPHNLGCVTIKSVYNFVFKVTDNFCPSPSVNFNTFTIVVLAPPPVNPARFKCLDVNPNGTTSLTFLPPRDVDGDTNKYFKAFYIYRSTTGTGGPYTLIDSVKGFSIMNYDTVLHYSDLTANANAGAVSYYITTGSGCDLLPRTISDTLSTIYLNVTQVGTNASLSWTPLESPLHSTTTGKYYIWKEQAPAGSNVWALLDSTTSLSYLDPVTVCNDSINYRIEVRDTSVANCSSRSNIEGANLQAATPVIKSPSLRCVNVLSNGDIQVSWVGSVDTASYFAGYTVYQATSLAGPYTNIGFVTNYAANTFTHTGANGQVQINYYFVTTTAGCDATSTDESVPSSDTLASMLLTANNPTMGFANLSWTAIHTPLPTTSTGIYNVYRRIPPTVAWTLIGDTTGLSYQDTIVLCDTIIEYKVEIADASGCISTSSIDGNNFTSQGDIIDNPEIRCLAVQANGDVQITWVAAPDPNNFFAGTEIYHATSPAGPYTKLTTVTTTATSWTHSGAGANTAVHYYYLKNLSGCDGITTNGSTSDTLQSMLLSVSNANLGFADLSWNALHTPKLASAAVPYRVMRRSTGVGAYVQIGTTNNLTFRDTIAICNVPYEYRIELDDNAPCTSVSSADNDVFTYVGNIINNPMLRCVSVNPNGTIQLTWENPTPTSWTNFNEYEIWRNGGAGFTLIDSVSGSGTTTYTDLTANGNAQPYTYYLVTQSGCTGQATNGSVGNSLSSIFLTTAGVVGQANLNWTALSTPLPPTSTTGQYTIYNTYNAAGTLQLIGDTALLLYQHPIYHCDTLISHQVWVNDNLGCISKSNIATNTYTWIGNIVNNPDLRCVSVQPNGQIQLTWLAPTGSNGEFNEYEIWRNNGAGFSLVDSVSNFNQTTWTDVNVNGNAQSYGYYMLSQSGCTGQVNSPSNSSTLNSIHLTTSNATLGSAIMNWTALPAIASSAATGYDVWSSYPTGNTFTKISSTLALTASEAITNCDTTLRHQISLADACGCVSNSNIDTNTFTWIGNIVNNPDLRCVSVQPNGQIQLTWITPSGSSGEFNEYEIWRNNGSGFVLYDSISNFNQTTWTDVNANGNAQSYSYYMLSQSGCTGQVNSPANSATLSSIYLTTSNATLGSAILNWTALPALPTSNPAGYGVESSYPTGNTLSYIWSTASLTYTEAILNCDTTLRHRITMSDNSGCVSNSNIDTNNFTWIGNIVNNPDLRCVSVQPNGQIQLTWLTPSGSSGEFNEYEIWRNNGSGFVRYDSISNFNQTTWTDAFANGNAQSYSYYMLSQSGCTGQVNSPANSATLSSIYLTTSNATLGSANLSWNGLPLLPTSAATGYDVWSSYPNGNTLSVISSTLALNATEAITDCDTTLLHRISVADASGCVSNSNIDTNNFTWIGNIVSNPDLRCVSVQPNGQVQLTWITPAGSSNEFNEYEIWRDNGTGFTLYDSISNFNQTTWTDVNANGNAQSYGYYMLSQSGCTGQVNSPANSTTLHSIHLTTSNATLGSAVMNWNALPALASSAATGYDVWSSYPNGNTLSVISSTNGLTASENITDCDTTLRHQISIADNSGCVSNSNVDTNTFTWIGNIVNNPDLRCVSVLANGQIQLTWVTPTGSSNEFNEFEIFRNSGAGFVLYDSVSNFNQTTWTDAFANGNAQSYAYYMRSQSGCTGQVDNGSTSATLNSIYLTTTSSTLGQANLNWNALPLLPTSAATGYDVWSSYPNGNALSVISSTQTLSAVEAISNCDTTLRHQISVADNSGCTSFSNIDTNTFTYIGNVIDHPELRCASVLPNGQVQLTWVNPTPSTWDNFNQYNIWRNTGAGFTLIDSIETNTITGYLDATANGNAGSVSYYLQTKSGCTGQTDPSAIGGSANGNTLRTIYLVVSGGNTTTATLNWNAVSTPLLATASGNYTIEREYPGGSGNWSTAGTTSNTTWQEPLTLCVDSVNYRVSTGDAQGCTSMSNVDGEIFVDHHIPAPPSTRCASVQVNGHVDLSWVIPTDTGQGFANYKIYRAAAASGPYSLITTITNYATSTFTDNTVNAQGGSYYYYITTQTSCGGETSPGSDTLRTIKVDVINNNGVAIVTWNPIHNPELATATQQYTVYKEYPAGTWSIVGNTTAPVYQWFDTINVCSAVINYRVATGDAIGCTSNSSIDGDLFHDVTRPDVALLDTVSLDPLNPSQVSISWLPSPSGDVVGYIIYHFNGASWDSIGGLTGINASYFLDNNPAAALAPQRYSIAAFDSCGNVSNIGVSHNTLFITAKLDICRSAIDLRWNPYINMVGGVGQYNVYVSENGGPYTYLASVPGSNMTYSHTTLNNGSEYCYFVQAQGNTVSRTASSNTACEIANLLTLPTFSYLKKATVIDLRRVVVECYVDTANNPDVSKYKLQRAFDKNGPFTTVSAISYTGQPIISFNDFSARTDQYSYYYRVITIDSCGNEVLTSNIGRTILLTGQPDFNLVNKMTWNIYEEWLGNVSNYSLFRSVDGIWSPTPIVVVNNGTVNYDDDIADLYKYPNYSGKFCYRIEAYEGPGNTYGFKDTSISNEFCLVQEPHLFIPSAFTPDGKNPIFKPEFIYIDAKNFYFVVYNRWGQKVYETRTPGEGWDGTYQGNIAPEGTYAYTVRIFGTNGQEIEKSGSVTLLR
ncbi:MAG: gliding motility-associated C-terminal domain-containing protein [Bacteroidia bacterium]